MEAAFDGLAQSFVSFPMMLAKISKKAFAFIEIPLASKVTTLHNVLAHLVIFHTRYVRWIFAPLKSSSYNAPSGSSSMRASPLILFYLGDPLTGSPKRSLNPFPSLIAFIPASTSSFCFNHLKMIKT